MLVPIRRDELFSNILKFKTMFDIQKKMLHLTVKEMLVEMRNNADCLHVRALAFDAVQNGKRVQVHVLVTQDKDDFLKQFQVEYLREGKI